MFEISGKYNIAKVLASEIDENCYQQIQELVNSEYSKGCNIAIMPDCHYGNQCVIGYTATITDKVIPNLIGTDIGCGLFVCKISKKDGDIVFQDLAKIDEIIRQRVPIGKYVRKQAHPNYVLLKGLLRADLDYEKYFSSIGTLGSGNHFIELDKDEAGDYYLVVHTGSRSLGRDVCNYYQNKIKLKKRIVKERLIEKLKAEGKLLEIQTELDNLQEVEFTYLDGKDMEDYLNDMKIAQHYAKVNRKTIICEILAGLSEYIERGIYPIESFHTIHNYIDVDNMIVRKGAISARKGEKAIIPINMRDGALLVTGKGNEEYNYSCPHGAGRLMSRTLAKQTIDVQDFKDSMEGVFSTSISKKTVDESPFAYKPIESIMSHIAELCTVDKIIKPIYNLKADT